MGDNRMVHSVGGVVGLVCQLVMGYKWLISLGYHLSCLIINIMSTVVRLSHVSINLDIVCITLDTHPPSIGV